MIPLSVTLQRIVSLEISWNRRNLFCFSHSSSNNDCFSVIWGIGLYLVMVMIVNHVERSSKPSDVQIFVPSFNKHWKTWKRFSILGLYICSPYNLNKNQKNICAKRNWTDRIIWRTDRLIIRTRRWGLFQMCKILQDPKVSCPSNKGVSVLRLWRF